MSTPTLDARARALETTAWGEKFHFFQPRNIVFWMFLWLCGTGVVKGWQMFSPLSGYFGRALLIASVVGVVSALVWGWWFRFVDRYERQPISLVITAFVWGATAAAFAIAVTANTALGSLYGKLFGQVWAQDWHAGLSAPFVEETAKGVGIVVLLALAPRLVRTATDGLLLGAFIGLGFQTSEDLLYSVAGATEGFGAHQTDGLVESIATRIYSDIISHPLFTALFCAGVIYLIGTPAQPRRIARGLALIVVPVVVHGVWDSMLAIAGGTGLLVFVIMLGDAIFALTALWIAFVWAHPREAHFVRDVLAPEVESGVLTDDEVTAAAGWRQQRQYVKAGADRAERKTRRHIIRGALDLLSDLAISKGHDSDDVLQARAEITRLRSKTAPVHVLAES
ncbi:RsiW-degrading membrane proteinase PrsW (M82 family) [Williamsia limnetica]|uniref:RsiW-degrading membrane proteinase PrsW (M82 family) n=1 Tax=Williamsia limnetica TaxID=882452 RepID=A0A318RJB6_WILLI|nr:PrsW family glutamic-type intramembrane protease [Williamsia limnetica]PYE17871.1 RsiW-degrading membrane proteinase PrsW (M82 family) [Williamsia limnetica]